MDIGPYWLDQEIEEVVPSLTEASAKTYAILGRSFAGEKIFEGSDVEFLDVRWDCILAVTNNRIYKISIQHYAESSLAADLVCRIARDFLVGRFGLPAEDCADFYLWRKPEFNIILNQSSKLGMHVANLTLTSGAPFKQMVSSQSNVNVHKHRIRYQVTRIRYAILKKLFG